MKNLLLFAGVCFGTILLFMGVISLVTHDTTGWLYIVGGCCAFMLAATPGIWIRKRSRGPDA